MERPLSCSNFSKLSEDPESYNDSAHAKERIVDLKLYDVSTESKEKNKFSKKENRDKLWGESNQLDLVFLLDATSSMETYIKGVKDNIKEAVTKIFENIKR